MRALTAFLFISLQAFFFSGPVFAQPDKTTSDYQPEVGQQGKDVIWVPTPQELVDKMLEMAKLTPKDFLMDLGSGDGRTVITAAKRGAHALGIEYNPDMVALSQRNAQAAGVSAKAKFQKADLFETDLSKATVITMFLLPDINMKLRPKLLDLKPGTRIVSNTFTLGDWQPDDRQTVEGQCKTWCTALLWIVPAKVEGTHKIPQGELLLKQEFQMISGTLTADGRTRPVHGKVQGEELVFSTGSREYRARMKGRKLEME